MHKFDPKYCNTHLCQESQYIYFFFFGNIMIKNSFHAKIFSYCKCSEFSLTSFSITSFYRFSNMFRNSCLDIPIFRKLFLTMNSGIGSICV